MPDEKNFILDRRRFPRVDVILEIAVFSSQRTLLGTGELKNISASGLKFKTGVDRGISKGGDIIVSFTLPDGPAIEKLHCEIKTAQKLEKGYFVGARFSQLKAIDMLRDYIEKKINSGKKTPE